MKKERKKDSVTIVVFYWGSRKVVAWNFLWNCRENSTSETCEQNQTDTRIEAQRETYLSPEIAGNSPSSI
jgi:hypothetical protein